MGLGQALYPQAPYFSFNEYAHKHLVSLIKFITIILQVIIQKKKFLELYLSFMCKSKIGIRQPF